jgi:hypothetical protein
MTVTINKNTTKGQRKKLLKKISPKPKTLDIDKFSGKLEWKGDPLSLQKEWRDE